MAASIEKKGYRETTVADVVRIARTSRRNYYEHFDDRGACFLALFDATNEDKLEQIATAVRPDQPWEQQVDDAIGAYLDTVAARPALSQSFVRELPALGHAGAACQRAAIERMAELLVTLVESWRREQPEIGAHPLTTDMAVLGAVAAIVLVLAVAQIVLPAIAAQRAGDRVARYGSVRSVSVSAVPAITLLWGDMERVSVSAGHLRASSAQMADLLWSVRGADRAYLTAPSMDVVVSSLGGGELPLRAVKFAKHGDDLTVRAGVQGTDLRVALPAGFEVHGLMVSDGEPEVQVRGNVLGVEVSARAVLAAVGGRLVAELLGVPFAGLVNLTLFGDPRISVQGVTASPEPGGYVLTIQARMVSA
jgi:AcrR family transcriptional regulator